MTDKLLRKVIIAMLTILVLLGIWTLIKLWKISTDKNMMASPPPRGVEINKTEADSLNRRFFMGTSDTVRRGVFFRKDSLLNLIGRYNGIIMYYGFREDSMRMVMVAKASNGDMFQFLRANPESFCVSRNYYELLETGDEREATAEDLIKNFISRWNNREPGVFFSRAVLDSVLSRGALGVVFYFGAEGTDNPMILTRARDYVEDEMRFDQYGRYLVSDTYCPRCCGLL